MQNGKVTLREKFDVYKTFMMECILMKPSKISSYYDRTRYFINV